MLTLWGRKTSVNVQKPMWLIGELGLSHERKDVGGAFGGLDTPEYGAMNPSRLVPTLQDGDTTVWESEAVLRYLGASYAEQYFPADNSARATVDQWMCWVQSTWAPAMTGVFGTLVRVAKVDREASVLASKIETLGATAAFANTQLEARSFLAGEELTLADFAFASFLYRYYSLEFSRAELPALRRYYDQLCERPAYVEHIHIDYDVLRVPGAERST